MSACGYSSIDYNFLISSPEKFVYEERRIVSVEMKAIHFKSIYSGSAAPRSQLAAISFMSAELSECKRWRGWKRETETRQVFSGSNTSAQCAPTSQLTCVRRFLTNTFLLTEKRGRLYLVRCWRKTVTFNSRRSFRVCLEKSMSFFCKFDGTAAEGVRGPFRAVLKWNQRSDCE